VALADKLDTLTGFWAIDEKPTGSKDPFALRRAALGEFRLLGTNGRRVPLMPFITRLIQRFHEYPTTVAFSDAMRGIALIVAAEPHLEDSYSPLELFDHHIQALSDFNKFRYDEFTRLNPWKEFSVAALAKRAEDWRIYTFEQCQIKGADLLTFFHDRLKVYLRDQGIRHDIIDAVIAMPGNDDLVLLVNRATALNDVLKTEDGTNLLQGLKRAGNILAQAEEKDGVEYSFGADPKFAETDAERALFAALDKAEPAIREAVRLEDFQAATQGIATLRGPIDAFFDTVQINTDNQIVRRNRLNLLSRIREAGRLIADFGRIEG